MRLSRTASESRTIGLAKALLDTSAVIGLFAGEPAVVSAVERRQQLFLPVIALAELYYGAFRSARRANNIARLDEFAETITTLDCDASTARVYGEAKAILAGKGRPIPENDLWIAALALQHRLVVLTRDPHFKEVDGLGLEFVT